MRSRTVLSFLNITIKSRTLKHVPGAVELFRKIYTKACTCTFKSPRRANTIDKISHRWATTKISLTCCLPLYAADFQTHILWIIIHSCLVSSGAMKDARFDYKKNKTKTEQMLTWLSICFPDILSFMELDKMDKKSCIQTCETKSTNGVQNMFLEGGYTSFFEQHQNFFF